MTYLVFIHGLNTYGDDALHVGPLTLGTMHERMESALLPHGIRMIAAAGFGSGSPEIQADKIRQALMLDARIQADGPIHFLGQSTGGLVARVLATHPEFQPRTRSVITVGTPHHGALVADLGMSFEKDHPLLSRIFAFLGYDTSAKTDAFQHLTPAALKRFNERFPTLPSVRYYSLICEVQRRETSWPLLFFDRRLHPLPATAPEEASRPLSDGFILCESQHWGIPLGPFRLDHFGELGYFLQLRPSQRKNAELEFHRMVSMISEIISK